MQDRGIQNRVIAIMADQFGVNADRITLESDLVGDLGADSLDKVELVMEVEEEFDISISDDTMDNIHTVGDCVRVVEDARATTPEQ